MDTLLKDLEIKFGDLRDSMSMRDTYTNEDQKKEARDRILFRSIKLIIELLFFIIRRQH